MPTRAPLRKASYWWAILILIVIAVIAGGTVLFSRHSQKAAVAQPDDPFSVLWTGNFAKDREYWKGQMDKLGAEKAYELFKEDTQGKEFGVAHTLAHVMGQLIYQKEGLEGIAVCDGSFAFGCYHSFFGAAIKANGIQAIPELADACRKRWGEGLGCPHGIGHGILSYLGDDKLEEALGICSTLPWKNPFGGCHSGVLMEFNFHTMESITGSEDRPLDPKNPYDPCNRLPAAFGESCYFEQPQWWLSVFSHDYEKVGKLCLAVADKAERVACFQGVGNVAAPEAMYDVDKTRAACALMPTKEGVSLCLQRASWAIFAEPSAKDKQGSVCAELPAAERAYCAGGSDSGSPKK